MRIFIALVFVVGCKASAQGLPDDPLGPVRCFEIADAKQLSSDSAYQLCTGALSDAPGRCYATAIDQFHNLSQQQILQLCSGATSQEPLGCFANLTAGGELTEDQMIQFCSTRCAVGPPPPQVSNAACMGVAINEAGLALQTAGQLCTGARSAGPAQCFLEGSRINHLAESKLVDMCTESRRCQYVTSSGAVGAAAGGGGGGGY
jgi:hypothetical protein